MIRSRLWRAATAAVVSSMLIVPAVSAAELIVDDGSVGESYLKYPEAYCYYRPSNTTLKFIRVLKPTVYSNYPAGNNSWVGWRAKIYWSQDHVTNWKLVHKSSWQKDRATDTTPADDFRKVEWDAPTTTAGWYRAQIVVVYYKPGSRRMVEGKQVWDLNNFTIRYVGSSNSYGPFDDCPAQD